MNKHQEHPDTFVEQLIAPLVLVLEDEALIGIDLEAALADGGFDVGLALSCAEATTWLNDHSPTAAVLDFRLRDGDCVGVAKTLIARGIPFLIHTGDRLEGHHEDLLKDRVVYKPVDARTVVEIVRSMVARETRRAW